MASEANHYAVHLGFWTNWSYGKVQGATITLTHQNGNFLIAFLAIFVGMTGKSFWRLGCFSLHRYFSSSGPQDGLYHQRQAILRNSDTAQDGAWRLSMSLMVWHSGRKAQRILIRLLPLIVFALVTSGSFGVASIFSSRVTSDMLNEVLLTGHNCGTLSEDKAPNASSVLTLFMPYWTKRSSQVLNYGDTCYTNASYTDGCNLYIQPHLPLKSARNISCPFGDDICILGNDNLELDTGYLNSLEHLGLNTPPSERFQLRFVHQCAPIKTEGYVQTHNDSQFGPINQYLYGFRANPVGMNGTKWTYEIPVNNSYIPTDGTTSVGTSRYDYSVGADIHYATPNETVPIYPNAWLPIPALNRDDADVEMVYLSAPNIRFSQPVDDPLYSAHVVADDLSEINTGDSLASYLQDDPMRALACTMQMQYCNPNLPIGERCEPLRGTQDPRASATVKKIFGDGKHFDTVNYADNLWQGSYFSISNTIAFIGASALQARYGLTYGFQGPLPDNQWEIETTHWVKGMLSSLQDAFVSAANGPPQALDMFLDQPLQNDTTSRNLCANQKIVSTQYSSFNVLGISLIFLIGAWIILLDMTLEPAIAWWQRRRYNKHQLRDHYYAESKESHPLYAALEWSHTSTLQLQRLVHEEAGYGTWTFCEGDTPATLPDQRLGALDLTDIKHPVLKRAKETPKEWDVINATKPWGLRRSDTGMDTLVEEHDSEDMKKHDDSPVPSTPTSASARPMGLGLQDASVEPRRV